jgi:hypothetical protein
MRLNNSNDNIKPVNSSKLCFAKENIIIFFYLVLFTAISMVLISFCSDILINSFSQGDGENSLLKEENICLIAPETIPCLSMKRDLGKNGLSIFDTFIDLFNKNHPGYRYFPSYFQPFTTNHTDSILSNKPITLLCINETEGNLRNLAIAKEVISYNEYLLLEHHNNHLNAILNDLCKILLEYRQSNSL